MTEPVTGGLAQGFGRRGQVAAWLVGYCVSSGAQFAVAVVTARVLGAGGKGELTLWTLLAIFLAPVLAAGIPDGLGILRLRGRSGQLRIALAHTALVLVIAIPAGTAAWALGADAAAVVLFGVIAVPIAVLGMDVGPVLQARGRAWLFHVARTLASIFTIALILFALAFGTSHKTEFVWIAVTGGTLVGGIFLALCIRERLQSGRVSLREAMRTGVSAWPQRVLEPWLGRLDQMVLGLVSGSSAVGLYSVAVNFTEAAQTVGAAVGQTVFLDEERLPHPAAMRILFRTYIAVLGLGFAVAAVSFVAIPVLFGSDFADARWAALALAPSPAGRSAAFVAETMLVARGVGGKASVASFAALAIGAMAWPVGALLGGMVGVAIATSLVKTAHAAIAWSLVARSARPNSGTGAPASP